MKLVSLVELNGPERLDRARQAAQWSAEQLKLGTADAKRLVEGVVGAVEIVSTAQDTINLAIGVPAGGPSRVNAWLRTQGSAVVPSTDERFQSLADEVSVRDLPGGLVTTILRWRIAGGVALAEVQPPSTVCGSASEWALQSLGFLERTLLSERRVRAGQEELIGIVTHALRNPIGSMASATDLLQLSPSDPATLEAAVGILARSSRAALRLIADLEQLNQIDSGALRLKAEEIRPSLIADTATELARPLASRRGIEIRTEKDGTQRYVLGDADRLIQAIGNLVVAAVEQSPDGEPVTLRVRSEDPYIVFEIEDRGPHVPDEAMPTFFDRMRKSGPRRRAAGAFGLAAARELIEAHSGSIACTSVSGGTTVFKVTLPGA